MSYPRLYQKTIGLFLFGAVFPECFAVLNAVLAQLGILSHDSYPYRNMLFSEFLY